MSVEGKLAVYHLTALVTCLAILMYFLFSFQVGKARGAGGIKAPAISGNPDFERVFRAHVWLGATGAIPLRLIH